MHNLALLTMPFGYSLSMILKTNGRVRTNLLILLFIIMHPLMVGLFIAFAGTENVQTYQIISALILLPLMAFLENKLNLERI
jgi:hypothetical protein